MPNEIKTKPGIAGFQVVQEPTLITVKVLKAKYLEQMNPIKVEQIDTAKFVGFVMSHGTLIFLLDNGDLAKMHQMSFFEWRTQNLVITEGLDFADARNKAGEELNNLFPQIFTD